MTDDEAEIFGPIDPELHRRAAEIRAAREAPQSHPFFEITAERIHKRVVRIDALPPRYTEIVALIADGYSNQEIADQIYLSIETVKSHVRGLIRAFGARNRCHVVSLAYRHRVLTIDEGEQ